MTELKMMIVIWLVCGLIQCIITTKHISKYDGDYLGWDGVFVNFVCGPIKLCCCIIAQLLRNI